MDRDARLQTEQAAYDRLFPSLLATHPGEYVVIKDGTPVGFYPSFPAAYSYAVERFGLDDVFVVSKIVERTPEPVSLAWEAGVLVDR